ncbi:hypothetical protein [uncultured Corynebacterium sp.]|nr:hypothetical protein [uncultured Corynebacterium sp.]
MSCLSLLQMFGGGAVDLLNKGALDGGQLPTVLQGIPSASLGEYS